MNRGSLLAVLLSVLCLPAFAQTESPAWKRAEHLQHGINASEWLAQSHDYSPQRLRSYSTLEDIARCRLWDSTMCDSVSTPLSSNAMAYGASASECRFSMRS